jgi:hypothetical protein
MVVMVKNGDVKSEKFVTGGVPGKCCDQSLRIPIKSEGIVMKAGAFI